VWLLDEDKLQDRGSTKTPPPPPAEEIEEEIAVGDLVGAGAG